VQVYLGVDGWKPHHVDFIHRSLYGDCKDLSVYMIALLEKANITAFPALALTRSAGWVDPSFPGNNFNHCIVAVPFEQDTLWLECTSDVAAFNDIPSSIEGINVLLIKPDGAELVQTPTSPAAANKSSFVAEATVSHDRSLAVRGELTLTGNLAIDARRVLQTSSPKERIEWFLRKLVKQAGSAKVQTFKIKNLEYTGTDLSITFDFKLNYFARKAGSRLIFAPDIFRRSSFKGEDPDERTMPLTNMSRFVLDDSITFSFPPNYALPQTAKMDTLRSKFGQYAANFYPDGDDVVWTSTFVSRAREVSLKEYPAYFDFMEAVNAKVKIKKVLHRRKN